MPTTGGLLIINNENVGEHDYVVKNGPIVIDNFDWTEWFTDVEDSRSAWCVVKGDLTIDAGQVFIPPVRKLFTVLYVDGDLIVNGTISMTARGANHSTETGSGVPAAPIRIANGTHDGIIDPEVPASGADGAPRLIGVIGDGQDGDSGMNGQSGGGGGGGSRDSSGSHEAGGGADGTAFSGGPGGGAMNRGNAEDGHSDGGKGGDGDSGTETSSARSSGGGAGNPGGIGAVDGDPGDDGTGGTLIVIVTGQLSGSGVIVSGGADGGDSPGGSGGGSGGGSITVLYGTNNAGPTPTAPGGLSGTADFQDGGDGGNGTARKLELAT